MATVNRAALLTKMHKTLKKRFTPVASDPKRSLLEHLLYAALLENSPAEEADTMFATIPDKFFDLNEVRVSTVREIAETIGSLKDPEDAARRFKGVLQSVFEAHYDFDVEFLKKQNLGQAIKKIEKYEGSSRFMISYVTQVSLGGHSIPVNRGAMQAFVILGIVTESEAAKNKVPGLERAISKNKGIEFGSLLHQLGVMLNASPYSKEVRDILLEINPECKDRLPKRQSKKAKAKKEAEAKAKEKAEQEAKRKAAAKKEAELKKKKSPTKKKVVQKKTPPKKATAKKTPARKTAATKKKKKKAVKKTAARKKVAKKKTATKKTTATKAKKKPVKKKKKTATRRISKRKPR